MCLAVSLLLPRTTATTVPLNDSESAVCPAQSEMLHIIFTVTSANGNYASHWASKTHAHVFI